MNALVIERGGRTLVIPRTFDKLGVGQCTLDGMSIPAHRLWDLVLEAISSNTPIDQEKLFEEGLRAEIYRLAEGHEMVYSTIKTPGLVPILDPKGNPYRDVWVQKTMLRVRPIAAALNIELAVIRGEVDIVSVRQLLRVAEERYGLQPVAAVDKRVFFHTDPESIFEKFGTRDWRRLGVYFKRPGTSSVRLDFTGE
jgi:hypothetical protein